MADQAPPPGTTYNKVLSDWLRKQLAVEGPLDRPALEEILRAMAVWRANLLSAALIRAYGAKVLNGPFAGMDYVGNATEGALTPRLLGSYESELHPTLERFAREGFERVIDVGCAEGYYAVGLARLMPQATIHAHDTDARAQAECRDLAAKNGVEDRVVIGGQFNPADFQAFAGAKTLVICDCEGAEVDVLQPDLAPALAGMWLIVETHNVYRRDALETIWSRFAPTHDIQRIDLQPKTTPLPKELAAQSHMDQLLSVWEWRRRPTPWLVMTPKTAL